MSICLYMFETAKNKSHSKMTWKKLNYFLNYTRESIYIFFPACFFSHTQNAMSKFDLVRSRGWWKTFW